MSVSDLWDLQFWEFYNACCLEEWRVTGARQESSAFLVYHANNLQNPWLQLMPSFKNLYFSCIYGSNNRQLPSQFKCWYLTLSLTAFCSFSFCSPAFACDSLFLCWDGGKVAWPTSGASLWIRNKVKFTTITDPNPMGSWETLILDCWFQPVFIMMSNSNFRVQICCQSSPTF